MGGTCCAQTKPASDKSDGLGESENSYNLLQVQAGGSANQDDNGDEFEGPTRMDIQRHVGSDDPKRASRSSATTAGANSEMPEGFETTNLESNEISFKFNGRLYIGTEEDIPEDAYGAAVLCIVKEIAEIRAGMSAKLSVLRFVTAMGLLILNVALQGGLLWQIRQQIVQPSVHHVQSRYKEFKGHVFDDDNIFQKELWDEYPHESKKELCSTAVSNRFFYYPVVYIWTILMLKEMRTSLRLITTIFYMPHCKRWRQMMFIDGPVHKICALTSEARAAILLLICLPKVIVACCLLALGLRWLTAATAFEHLILNSVAMEFIINIDEWLYDFGIPKVYRGLVQASNFFHEKKETESEEHREEWSGVKRTAIFVFLSIFCPAFYAEIFQDVLPVGVDGVRQHCGEIYASEEPICGRNLWAGKFFANFAQCFPAGGVNEL